MANILLVDPDTIAQRAMRGIVVRGPHRFAAVCTIEEAKTFIHHNALVDLVFVELNLADDESGLTLIQELRRDDLLRGLPVAVYTAAPDRDGVRQALALGVQNFLIKPYLDSAVFTEVGKALARPWRDSLFIPEKRFCAQLDLTPAEVRHRRHAFLDQAAKQAAKLRDLATYQNRTDLISRLEQLAEDATGVGAPVLVTHYEALQTLAAEDKWGEIVPALDRAEFVQRLMNHRDGPEAVPEGFATSEERRAQDVAQVKARWTQALEEHNLPALSRAQLTRELDALPAFPVVDSAAAAFQMSATGHPSSLAPLMDLAEKDPGLSAQLLMVTNKMRGGDDYNPVESARLCIGLLGETRLSALARSLVIADTTAVEDERFNWSQFWMFQLGVARLARDTCTYLELESLELKAYTAGLLHELGKLLLLHLHPGGLLAILEQSRRHHRSMREFERELFQWTTPELAAHFAEQRGLPSFCCNVIRWIDTPAAAGPDAELAAIVSLARDLCLHNRVGYSGELVPDHVSSIELTPQWEVLQTRIFPSFNLRQFEARIHATCRDMKRELSGRSDLVCA